MKRQAKIYKFGVLLSVLFVALISTFALIDKDSFIVKQWFSMFMIFLSIFLFYKAYIFKSDSSFYFALVWLISFILMLITYIYNLSMLQIWPFFIFTQSFPYLVNYVVFKNSFFIKMFFITIFLFLIARLINYLLIFENNYVIIYMNIIRR